MRRFRTTIVLALATLLSVSICSAQQTAPTSVPNLIRYSGTLKDAQGAALSSSTAVGVTFSIYKQQDGGASVWMETQNVIPDSNGQYSVILGSTTATGLPDDLFSQQEQRWLGVQVQGQDEQARVLLVSVPYAFKAHEAETLGGLPPSAFVQAPPSDGSGSTSTGAGTAVNAAGVVVSTKTKAATDTTGVLPPGMLSLDGIDFWGRTPGNVARHDYTATSETNGAVSNKIFIGGDNTNSTFPPIPFDKIQVSIGTKAPAIVTGHVLTLFSPSNPSLGISARPTGVGNPPGDLELAIASCAGCYSNFAVSGDAVLRVPGGGPAGSGNRNLILTNRDSNNGAIRFGTGTTVTETERMTLTHNGNFGIANNQPQRLFAVGPVFNGFLNNSPFEVDTNGDMVTIKKLAYSWPTAQPTLNQVLTAVAGTTGTLGVLGWTTPSGGGNVNGPVNCAANFLTKWAGGGPNVDCSNVWENSTSDHSVGIGPFSTSPVEQLDVRGDINVGDPATYPRPTQHYRIIDQVVLSIPLLDNTFVGVGAGAINAGGEFNTFTGYVAGNTNVNGQYNSYYGYDAGASNGNGNQNTCDGSGACFALYAGSNNTILGALAGAGPGGSNNTFVGERAGFSTSGDNNIYVGSGSGGGTESNTTRIGTTQTNAYMAGIFGVALGAGNQEVCIDATGHLGTGGCTGPLSSRRFKEQIASMGDTSSKLFQLRPVTFFYKPQYDDGSHHLQYGLIAEEVAQVYPELVAYEKDGTPYTVKYQLLPALLLNELQKQHKVVGAQQDELQTQLQQIKTQQQQMQAQRHEIDGLKLQLQQQNASLQERLTKLESYVATQMKTASDNPPRTTPGANGGLQ